MDSSWQKKQALDRDNLARSRRNNFNSNSTDQDTSNPVFGRNRHPNQSNLGRSNNDKEEASEEDTSSSETTEAGNTSSESDEVTDVLGDVKAKASGTAQSVVRSMIIKVAAPYIIVGALLLILILALVFAMQNWWVFFTYNANSVYSNTTSFASNTYLTSEKSILRPQEELFYQKVDEVKALFQEKLNISIDNDYIIGALFYDNSAFNFLETENLETMESTGLFENALEKIYILAQYQIITHYYENSSEFKVVPEDKREIAKNDEENIWTWFLDLFNNSWSYKEQNIQTHYGEFENTDPTYNVDVSKEGVFYWNLVDEDFITTYYSYKFTDNMTAEEKEARKIQIVDGIYRYIEEYKRMRSRNYGYLTDGLKVNLYTCDFDESLVRVNKGYSVSTLANEGTSYPSYTNFKNYVKGAIYGEVPSSLTEETKESVKAFIVAFSSYALARASYSSGATEIDVHVGDCWQLSCDPLMGCQYCHSKIGKYGTNITGVDSTCPNGRIWSPRKPLYEATNAWFDSVVDEVFGTVMMNASGSFFRASHYNNKANSNCGANCMGQSDAVKDAASGMTYEQILAKYYTGYELVNIKEDLYIQNYAGPGGGVQLNPSFNYYQFDGAYSGTKFCGRSNATIGSSGCGTTSGAIVVSLLKNMPISPVTIMQFAYSKGRCGAGIIGTDAGLYKDLAGKYQLNYSVVYKQEASKVLDALRTNKAVVVAHVPKNGKTGSYPTGSGHYITFVAVNNNGQVLVWDPGSRKSSRNNAWHDINELVKWTDAYYILSR